MIMSSSSSTGNFYCVKESKPCDVVWVQKYFKDCLCNLNDDVSFALGLVSLICWGVAEIPQIVTNFRTKSSHGVSLSFLLAWVAGDAFNLVGCLLEAATLPTQFYTALLYTISTLVLVLQTIYYDHIYRFCKQRNNKCDQKNVDDDEEKPLKPPKPQTELGIPIPHKASQFYFTSARSMAGSGTPPFRSSCFRVTKSGPSAMVIDGGSSSDEEDELTQPFVTHKSTTQPRPIPRPAGYATFFAATVSLPLQTKGLADAYMGFSGRRLLQERVVEHSALGQLLGWLMAAIYMGGRIPQIWLNIKRGSVEGLNPLMFVFALIANVTYVGSILVRTTEWESIKANMPWLLDAIVCVALDLFIILQYIYYRYFRKKTRSNGEEYGDYVEADKAFVS